MQHGPGKRQSDALPRTRRAAVIDRLRLPPALAGLSYIGMKFVIATRILAMSNRAGRDPLLDLMQRTSCMETARTFITFADTVGACWPESVMVMRPCCRSLSPDEYALACMADAATAGDRGAFCNVVEGLVRRDRHDRLYDQATRLAALMQ